MSRSNRRPTTNSRGSSSSGQRALSVTEAVQSIRLTETVGESPIIRRRPATRDDERSPYESSPSRYSTLDPSVLDSYRITTTSRSPYAGPSTSSASPYLSSSPTMSYPSYTQAPLSNPYNNRSLPPRSVSHYGKLANSYNVACETRPSSCRRPLNEVGYMNPSTGASMSRSMSGPSLPSMPPSAYEEFRNLGREFVERRRVPVSRPRRERKIRMRQDVLSSTPRPLQALDVSGSIDSFIAHSTSSYESPSPYTASVSHGGYTGVTSARSSPYDDPMAYPPVYSTSSGGSVTYASTTRGYTSTSPSAPDYSSGPRLGSHHGPRDPVVLDTPTKPQCWEHGCNGRQFSTFSNLLRHQREKSGSSTKSICHRCGAEFTRKTARDGHLAHDKCKQKSPGR